ncbi:hypothetical protein AAFF_G00323670 [Aldrovandia affinis]|uniref:Uncharacterized protein n=1 Tax=Aldrovandia affinis TaxID=143900 RepID=A0AAD7VZJ5_9TELE|nr:hypothetical protein AAFF_G00323670 [Aldrovandia affinis]
MRELLIRFSWKTISRRLLGSNNCVCSSPVWAKSKTVMARTSTVVILFCFWTFIECTVLTACWMCMFNGMFNCMHL